MSAHRHQAGWRSITFNRRYLDDGSAGPDDPANLVEAYVNSDYYLQMLDIVRVSAQDYRELRQFLEGADPNEAFEGLRSITGHGLIEARTPGELEDMTWKMYEAFSVAACRLAAQDAEMPGLLPFTFKLDTGGYDALPATTRALQFFCRPGSGRPVVIGRAREGLSRPFIFQLLAMDPFAYSQTQHSTALGLSTVVANAGNIYAKSCYELRFTGAGADPLTITNATTGQAFSLDASGALAGERWTLDTDRGELRGMDGSNHFGSRISGYPTELYLVPGNNTITLNDMTGLERATAIFRDAYA